MSYAALLTSLAGAVHEVGTHLLRMPRPAPALSLEAWRDAYAPIEGPAESIMRSCLGSLLPGVPWVDELDARLPVSGRVWVVDVVDGAVQFLQDLPYFCVSVALIENEEPVAAVLHAPLLGETYAAAKGEGATRNGKRISPSPKTDLSVALVATNQPPFVGRQPAAVVQAGNSLSAVLPAVGAVRSFGPTSWQIADTAAGRIDAFWEFGADEVNLLPGVVVAREAGAVVTDAQGQPWRVGAESFLVTSPGLHPGLVELLAHPGTSPDRRSEW